MKSAIDSLREIERAAARKAGKLLDESIACAERVHQLLKESEDERAKAARIRDLINMLGGG